MKKIFILLTLLHIACNFSFAQNRFTDSIILKLKFAKNDTTRVLMLGQMCHFYRYTSVDSSLSYGNRALKLAQQIKFLRGEADVSARLGVTYREMGDYPKSLELLYRALRISDENHFGDEKATAQRRMGLVYRDLKDYGKAIQLMRQAVHFHRQIHDSTDIANGLISIATLYNETNQLDSALFYAQSAWGLKKFIPENEPDILGVIGHIQMKMGHQDIAQQYFTKAVLKGEHNNDFRSLSFIHAYLAESFKQKKVTDSSIVHAKQGLSYGLVVPFKMHIFRNSNILTELYDSINPKEALHYYKIATLAREGLFGAGNLPLIQELVLREEARQRDIDSAKAEYQNRLRQLGLLAGLGVILIIALILYRNTRQQRKANSLLAEQKEKVESTLDELKSTQTQLIQSEKMASLGELTAGIAHEIQNPLNFVNNFSEVNEELLNEMKDELAKGKIEDAIALANDAIDNQKKINHHGKRADAIVKGMLQHSRSSSGVKEPTDINALCDEYLRLCYHGLRAKDKSFNATMKTDFDNSIGNISIVPQDMGRVILNLLTNAFYAVTETKNQKSDGFEPTVSISTKKIGNKVEIKVKDNGNGIPQKVLDKIFQPFFTTKPTGKGTGLGLSLSYDIVTKGHGGELKVETKDGDGTSFLILLPTA